MIGVVFLILVAFVAALGFRTGGETEGPETTALSQAAFSPQQGYPTYDDLWMLARVVSGEAHSEPYVGQVAVAAVILNRVQDPQFPGTVSEVIFEPWAFESVANGIIWTLEPTEEHVSAAQVALDGWDPSYGALYFWNPGKEVSPWIWTRNIVTSIGQHVFGL
ncbi:MAG: spore cortex-lytic protein [Firmicutes bacterium]|nr:spore cortex-lytic protein [Bacillota bacterium]